MICPKCGERMTRHGAIEKHKWQCAICKRLFIGFMIGGAEVTTEEGQGECLTSEASVRGLETQLAALDEAASLGRQVEAMPSHSRLMKDFNTWQMIAPGICAPSQATPEAALLAAGIHTPEPEPREKLAGTDRDAAYREYQYREKCDNCGRMPHNVQGTIVHEFDCERALECALPFAWCTTAAIGEAPLGRIGQPHSPSAPEGGSEYGSTWISVTDRLPVRYERVLVFAGNGTVTTAYRDGPGSWICASGARLETSHWMPLPEPPKSA